MIKWLYQKLMTSIVAKRGPDFVITNGEPDNPYLRRWYVVPRNPFFSIYLHQFLRSDEDDALHDHPWLFNFSILLCGKYKEQTIRYGGVMRRTVHEAGKWSGLIVRGPWAVHRVELFANEMDLNNVWDPERCWTLFVTGPRVREWGFHCPKGWKSFKEFYAMTDAQGRTGGARLGCGE